MPPVIDKEMCTGCGTCVDVCAEDVFFGSQKGGPPKVTYPAFCFHCGCCVDECPGGAITLRIPLPQMLLYQEK